MSSPAQTQTATSADDTPTPSTSKMPATQAKDAPTETALLTRQGRTTIADTVVEKIAGLAAREVNGVYKLGGNVARAFGAVRERIPGSRTNLSQGVAVEVGERQAAVDIDIVVEYGVEIGELTKAVRRNVITSIERMTALEVTEVNIVVGDVHIAGDDDSPEESRVQ